MAYMPLAAGIDFVLNETMRVDEQMQLRLFISHVEIARWHLDDDGAILARLNWMAQQAEPRIEIITLGEGKSQYRVVKRLR